MLLAFLSWTATAPMAAPPITWPEALYNPRPLADDVLLPLPCGGAMAFRMIATPPHSQGYPVTGPFVRADGTASLLLGKYEVSRLQAQAIASQNEGRSCPRPDAALQIPHVTGWWEAVSLANQASLWLMAHTTEIPGCANGATPCLPRVDEVPAFLRLPTDREWEYAARGGLAVTASEFAASRAPMPGGLGEHAWFQANAHGERQPIGQRQANPLGLHDLYGNVAEWVHEQAASPGQAALAVGGDAGSPEHELVVTQGWLLPPYATVPTHHTGLRLLASVPIYTTAEKVREAEQRGQSASPPGERRIPPPPPPVQFFGKLRLETDVAAQVLLDGAVIGRTEPGVPFEYEEVPVGERRIALRVEGDTTEGERHLFRTNQWLDVALEVRAEVEAARDERAWRTAQAAESEAGYRTYLAWCEKGPCTHREEAAKGLKALEAERIAAERRAWREAQAAESEAGYRAYLEKCETDGCGHRTQAASRLEALETLPEMVRLEGGCYQMGSPASEQGRDADEKQHRVCVKGFKLARYEVTNRDFRRFRRGHDSESYKGRSLNGDDQPAVYVNWQDAQAYADWLSKRTGQRYRLPTEAEWEYAARAGTRTARFWGEDPNQACKYANVHDRTSKRVNKLRWPHHDCDDGQAVTAPVGRYRANAWGLYDMLGNVWEWTCSAYTNPYDGSESRCVSKNHTGRVVLRGGSWNYGPGGVRAANRLHWSPVARFDNVGFRLAQD